MVFQTQNSLLKRFPVFQTVSVCQNSCSHQESSQNEKTQKLQPLQKCFCTALYKTHEETKADTSQKQMLHGGRPHLHFFHINREHSGKQQHLACIKESRITQEGQDQERAKMDGWKVGKGVIYSTTESLWHLETTGPWYCSKAVTKELDFQGSHWYFWPITSFLRKIFIFAM